MLEKSCKMRERPERPTAGPALRSAVRMSAFGPAPPSIMEQTDPREARTDPRADSQRLR